MGNKGVTEEGLFFQAGNTEGVKAQHGETE